VRDAFIRELTRLAAADERIFTLTADLGVHLFDDLAERAPGRFLNIGIAEQNLVGVAAGLAYAGKTAVAYSIAPFVTSRPNDQIRVAVAAADANVKLVGVGGGVAYGHMGPTHHAVEDIAALRALPNMVVLTPGDPAEAAAAAGAALAHRGPVYVRLGKNGEQTLLAGRQFSIGRALELRDGRDLTLASCGTMLPETLAAADLLARRGISAAVVHFGTVKPLDEDAILTALRRSPLLVTVEEHNVLAGFGGAVAEVAAESGLPVRLRRVGLPDTFAHAVGSRPHLLEHYGLDAAAIAASAATLVGLRAA
jgi:transketolase